jgi:hypothetical protein
MLTLTCKKVKLHEFLRTHACDVDIFNKIWHQKDMQVLLILGIVAKFAGP